MRTWHLERRDGRTIKAYVEKLVDTLARRHRDLRRIANLEFEPVRYGASHGRRPYLATDERARDPPRLVGIVKVELLYWDGCPSVSEARELLADALAARGITEPIVEREIVTHDDAVAERFPGSPTIRIDGVDIDQAGADTRYSLTCRIYRLPDGRVSPVPSRQQLEEALR